MYLQEMTRPGTCWTFAARSWIPLLLCWWGATAQLTAEAPEPEKAEVVLQAGTQADAEAALVVAKKILKFWEEKNYEEARKLVHEPVRDAAEKEMRRDSFKLQRIEKITLRKSRTGDQLVARLQVLGDPPPRRPELKSSTQMMDMIFLDGKWWMTAR